MNDDLEFAINTDLPKKIGEWSPEPPTEPGWYRAWDGQSRAVAQIIAEKDGVIDIRSICESSRDLAFYLWDPRPIEFLPPPEEQP